MGKRMAWLARKTEGSPLRAERVEPLRVAPVEVQIMGRDSLDVLRARNISATGLGIYVPHGFAGFDLAEEVELVVTLPSKRPFLARGIIKHLTETGSAARHFGLQFTRLEKRDRDALTRYVRSRRG